MQAPRGLEGGRKTNQGEHCVCDSHLRLILEHVLTEWKVAGRIAGSIIVISLLG